MYVFCLPNTVIVMVLSPRGWRSKFRTLRKHGLKNVVRETDEVGKGQIRMRTVFEQAIDQRSSTGARRNALSIWEPVCNEIFDRLIKPRWEIR